MSAPLSQKEPSQEPRLPSAEELAAARELVKAARDRGVALTTFVGLMPMRVLLGVARQREEALRGRSK